MAFLIDKAELLVFRAAIEEQEAVLRFLAAGIDANTKKCQPLAKFMEPYFQRIETMHHWVKAAKEVLEDCLNETS